ncbi:MAG: tetratricopeptide repeat protein [Deltaproteobacteria bacterium]|nr:tetratricopeptide repeat protein [Deltaproteobacteria bacterium]
MHTKKIAIAAGAAIVILIIVIGGYLVIGRKSGRPQDVYANAGGAAPSTQPANHSMLLSDLEARLGKNPDDTDTLTSVADTYFELKQFEKAAAYYKKVIEKKPTNTDVYNDIGLSFHYLGDSKEGLKYIEDGLKRNPYHQRMWLTKGFILAYGMGDLDGAKEAWEKSKALNPESRVGKAASDYLAQIVKR